MAKAPPWNKKYCPCLTGEGDYTQCHHMITKGIFKRFCNTANYPNCQYFAKKYGGMKEPMEWLQLEAVKNG